VRFHYTLGQAAQTARLVLAKAWLARQDVDAGILMKETHEIAWVAADETIRFGNNAADPVALVQSACTMASNFKFFFIVFPASCRVLRSRSVI
jgi:hypothetical protein